jgi:signal transduction histidine kinase
MRRVVVLLFTFVLAFCAEDISLGQDAGTVPLEDGYLLHGKGDGRGQTLYYYQVRSDTTVLIRQGRNAGSSELVIPRLILEVSNRRLKDQFPIENKKVSRFEVGLENESLVVNFIQQFRIGVLVGVLAVFFTLVGIAAWLWYRLRREQQRRVASEAARRFLAQGREKERQRLAREIHDGPVQDLHGLHFQMAQNQTNGSNGFGDELMRVTRELRAMSADLHPPALERFGLPAALRSHARRLRERNDALSVDIEIGKEVEASLDSDLRLALFRIAQEAMSNAAEHASTRQIAVRLSLSEEMVSLQIKDDGDGFDVPDSLSAKASDGHYGLLGMKERNEPRASVALSTSDRRSGRERWLRL